MNYFDALRGNGWVADPADRVHVSATHVRGCRGVFGGPCNCVPRLVLEPMPADERGTESETGSNRVVFDTGKAQAG